MKTRHNIENSRRVYAWLLGLYPKEYRAEYGEAMLQLFTDQCRAANGQRGRRGMFVLWLRTLLDLGKSALVEHFASPASRAGLLQTMPGAPLPWKGVLLVAIPGLIVFISQVGQLAGENWYYNTLSWVSYAFVAPVLLTWLLTKRFPVWGLVPLGLLLQRELDLLLYLPSRVYNWLASSPVRRVYFLLHLDRLAAHRYELQPYVQIILPILLLICAGWWIARQRKLTRSVVGWMVVYLLWPVLNMAANAILVSWNILRYMPVKNSQNLKVLLTVLKYYKENISGNFLWNVYTALVFLLIIMVGALLARRHGRLATLVLLGYILPTVVYGSYLGQTGDISFMFVVSTIFLYRLSVAIVGPLWITRAVTHKQQAWAVMLPMVIAVTAQIFLPLALQEGPLSPQQLTEPIQSSLMILAGSVLALNLYQVVSPKVSVSPEPAG